MGAAAAVVYPWDVTLARTAPDDSAQNHVAAPVGSLSRIGNRVRVAVGPLTAEVTAESAERLAVREGERDGRDLEGNRNPVGRALATVRRPGCPVGAEITPVEPDPGHAGEGST